METGRPKLRIAQSYNGSDADAALSDVHLALNAIGNDMRVGPGLVFFTTSVAIARGKAVNINGKLARLADAAGSIPAIGICVKAAASGQKAGIMLGMGFVEGLTGLTANSSIYLGNAGALVYTKPGAGFIQGLGYSFSTTELFVTISQP